MSQNNETNHLHNNKNTPTEKFKSDKKLHNISVPYLHSQVEHRRNRPNANLGEARLDDCPGNMNL
jgi:hypothetical protein